MGLSRGTIQCGHHVGTILLVAARRTDPVALRTHLLQVSPGGQLGGQVGKGGPVAMPLAPVGLAATTWLPEEGQVVLAQDSARPR